MAADTFLCFFCASDIRPTDDTLTMPSLGILVHKDCYERNESMKDVADDGWQSAA
jgi:hypothetical protein